MRGRLQRLTRRYSHVARQRGSAIRKAAKAFELVYFGNIHHDDDHNPVLGFTTSITHIDQHFSVGNFEGYNIRLLDRFDTVRMGGTKEHAQNWCVVEVQLQEQTDLPHICLVPTGNTSGEYHRLFTSVYRLQPLNNTLFHTHSMEVHGRFQILAPTSRTRDVETTLTSPLVMGIAGRFWPHGIELKGDTLYVYITDHRLSSTVIMSTISSALWLAHSLDAAKSD